MEVLIKSDEVSLSSNMYDDDFHGGVWHAVQWLENLCFAVQHFLMSYD